MTTITVDLFLYDMNNFSMIYHVKIEYYIYPLEQIMTDQINRDYEDLMTSAGLNTNDNINLVNFENIELGTQNGIRAPWIFQNNFNNENHLNNFSFDNTSFDDIDWNYPSS